MLKEALKMIRDAIGIQTQVEPIVTSLAIEPPPVLAPKMPHLTLSFCKEGKIDQIKLELAYPQINVNHRYLNPRTEHHYQALSEACKWGQVEVVKLLLEDGRADVNCINHYEFPLLTMLVNATQPYPKSVYDSQGEEDFYPCLDIDGEDYRYTPDIENRRNLIIECIALLVAEKRINLNLTSKSSPLYTAAYAAFSSPSCVEPILILLAYQLIQQNATEYSLETSLEAVENLLAFTKQKISDQEKYNNLLTDFTNKTFPLIKDNIADAVKKMRLLIEQSRRRDIAQTFGLIVFLSDNYLKLAPETKATKKTLQFLRTAKRLPMDQQMALCNRLHDSPTDIVTRSTTEAALRSLARKFS